MEISDKIKNFYQRWNVDLEQNERFIEFKERTIHSVYPYLHVYDSGWVSRISSIPFFQVLESLLHFYFGFSELTNKIEIERRSEFLYLIGKPNISHTQIVEIFREQDNFVRYIFLLQSLFWMKSLDEKAKEELYHKFQSDILLAQMPINLIKVQTDYFFYPSGAKLLDQALVNDILVWIIRYEDVYNNLKNALEKYEQRIYKRNLVDNLRLALELLLKHILNNNKSLENQKNELGSYLKNKNVTGEIRSMYWTLIKYYSDYQNNHAKHSDDVNDTEVEFILYLTGTFMRFLLITETKGNDSLLTNE